ncbi:hypothetical protein BC938DRAFT_482399 [Jimgerdemannia flammicorona]|uniref:Glutathione peroxidase n=1 Tax=Jimgerdemannia flammicorona TaxID=994334 RepID=A0A433QE03_9FUNG|nr:hypothetical protein BC938DRAFT_482399 [Jimgerdemannia flammicorona]
MSFYALSALNLARKPVNFESFRGKVVLIVNVASACGYTPQYKGLEQLYKDHQSAGLVILGFPSNQFGRQEPGTNEEISDFCERNYGVTFPLFDKIDVNGPNAHPVYTFLKSQQPGDIKWNFGKFLVDRQGNVVKSYPSSEKPESLLPDIQELLNN